MEYKLLRWDSKAGYNPLATRRRAHRHITLIWNACLKPRVKCTRIQVLNDVGITNALTA